MRYIRCISFDSYIKPQLCYSSSTRLHCCISFDSYIKPQRMSPFTGTYDVVYLLIPTSNHNSYVNQPANFPLYIF